MGCHFLLQEVFSIQGSNLGLLHWQVDSLSLNHQGSSALLRCNLHTIPLMHFTGITQGKFLVVSQGGLAWFFTPTSHSAPFFNPNSPNLFQLCFLSLKVTEFGQYLSCINWDHYMLFLFIFFLWFTTLTDICILNDSCVPVINPPWLWCIVLVSFFWRCY